MISTMMSLLWSTYAVVLWQAQLVPRSVIRFSKEQRGSSGRDHICSGYGRMAV
jgi:hypothetical protein